MIKPETLTAIGSFFKPHGIKGELTATLDYELEPSELRCIVLEIDGIFVPFFIESSRSKGAHSWLIKLDGVDSEKSAAAFSNHEIYAVTAELPEGVADEDEDGFYLYDLEGYTLKEDETVVGTIDGVDDSTANILLIVKTPEGSTVYVPFAEEFLTDIDKENHIITMNLPEGLIDLNN